MIMFVYSKFGGHPFSHLEMSKTMMWELNQRKKMMKKKMVLEKKEIKMITFKILMLVVIGR